LNERLRARARANTHTQHTHTHNRRAMLVGSRIVVFNIKCPELELHLTEDGFIALGTQGRSFQVQNVGCS